MQFKLFYFRGLVENHFELITKIINDFDQNLSSTLECQRIAIVVLCLCVSTYIINNNLE